MSSTQENQIRQVKAFPTDGVKEALADIFMICDHVAQGVALGKDRWAAQGYLALKLEEPREALVAALQEGFAEDTLAHEGPRRRQWEAAQDLIGEWTRDAIGGNRPVKDRRVPLNEVQEMAWILKLKPSQWERLQAFQEEARRVARLAVRQRAQQIPGFRAEVERTTRAMAQGLEPQAAQVVGSWIMDLTHKAINGKHREL